MDKTFSLLKKIGEEIKYSVVLTDIMLTIIYVLWLILTDIAQQLP